MKHELLFSGIGGQGIMMLGEILCSVAVQSGYRVTFAPFYGQEKRGGRTMCNIVIADHMESPIISQAELMLVMDARSFQDYEALIAENGLLLFNSSMMDCVPTRGGYRIAGIPFYEIAAEQAGSKKAANMAALGAVVRQLPFLSLDAVKKEMAAAFSAKPAVIPANLSALCAGYDYGF